MSPGEIVVPGELSTKPSPQTAEVSTPELWLGNKSKPPLSLNFARKNSLRLSALGHAKSA
jgi:hypothetical protein